jgi:hypothetical protein
MIKFTPTTLDDRSQILRWATNDPYHSSKIAYTGPGWWVMGSDCLTAFCVEDDGGPVMYMRLDDEDNLIRFHTQFAPEDEVDKHRVIEAIKQGLPALELLAKQRGASGLIFESTSPNLIRFMSKAGFINADRDCKDDYILVF